MGGWGWDGAASLTTRGIESGARRAFNGNRPRPDGMRMMRFLVNNRFPPRNGRVRGPSVTVWMDLPKLFCLGPFLLSKVLGEPVRQMWGPLTAWTPLIGGARGTARLPRLVRRSSHHNPFLSDAPFLNGGKVSKPSRAQRPQHSTSWFETLCCASKEKKLTIRRKLPDMQRCPCC